MGPVQSFTTSLMKVKKFRGTKQDLLKKNTSTDFDETYAHVPQLYAIRMLLDHSYIMNFKLFKMEVNNMFLKNYIQEMFVDQLYFKLLKHGV